MENEDSKLTEEELIQQKVEKEKRLDDLLKERVLAMSKIKSIVSEQSRLDKDIESLNKREKELENKLAEIKKRISEVSKEIDSARTEEEELEAHKKKTQLIQDTVSIEDELDDITRKKLEVLDKMKDLVRTRAEMEATIDRVEAEEITLRQDLTKLQQKTAGLLKEITKEIEEIDRGTVEHIEEKAVTEKQIQTEAPAVREEQPSSAPEKIKEAPTLSQEKPKEEKKGLFGVFGKKPKEETEINIGLLKSVLKVLDGLLEKLPDEVIDKFSASEDYSKYEKLYTIVDEYKGTPEEKEYIRKNTKTVLVAVDNLLRQLPKDVLEEFTESEDFERYNKVLESCGVG